MSFEATDRGPPEKNDARAEYGGSSTRRNLLRAAGVVAFNRGVYEFKDGTFALDIGKTCPVPRPAGPVSIGDARRRVERLKAEACAASPSSCSISEARQRVEAAKRKGR